MMETNSVRMQLQGNNIIVKKDYDGFEMRAFTGEYDAGYGKQDSISMQFGSTSEKSLDSHAFICCPRRNYGGSNSKSKSTLLGCLTCQTVVLVLKTP